MTQQTTDDQVTGRPAYATVASVAAVAGDLATLDASLGTAAVVDASTFELAANKGVVGGYAALNGSGLVPMSQLASGTPDGTKFVRDDGTLAVPSGGSDPWTNVVLGADFSTTSASNTSVTGLNFTPSANTTYLIEAYCLLRTATATVGPRPGCAFPSAGISDGAVQITAPNSDTALAFRADGSLGTATSAASTGVPLTTVSYLGLVTAVLVMGASPSGTVQITLASETAGTSVTMRAGSFLRYRTIS